MIGETVTSSEKDFYLLSVNRYSHPFCSTNCPSHPLQMSSVTLTVLDPIRQIVL